MTSRKKNEDYPDSRNISVDKAKALIQKAIDLRVLQQEYFPEDNTYGTVFVPGFLDSYNRRLDRIEEAGGPHVKYVFNWYEMGEAILDYWNDMSGTDGMKRLSDFMKSDVQDFRLMCDFIVRLMDRVHESSKKESKK